MIRNLKALLNSRAFKIRPFFTLVNGISLFFIILFNLSTKFEIKLNKKKIFFFFKKLRLNKFGGRGLFVFIKNIEPLMLCMSKIIVADDTIIDGGANFGMYTILFASQTKNNTVYQKKTFFSCLARASKRLPSPPARSENATPQPRVFFVDQPKESKLFGQSKFGRFH